MTRIVADNGYGAVEIHNKCLDCQEKEREISELHREVFDYRQQITDIKEKLEREKDLTDRLIEKLEEHRKK